MASCLNSHLGAATCKSFLMSGFLFLPLFELGDKEDKVTGPHLPPRACCDPPFLEVLLPPSPKGAARDSDFPSLMLFLSLLNHLSSQVV